MFNIPFVKHSVKCQVENRIGRLYYWGKRRAGVQVLSQILGTCVEWFSRQVCFHIGDPLPSSICMACSCILKEH